MKKLLSWAGFVALAVYLFIGIVQTTLFFYVKPRFAEFYPQIETLVEEKTGLDLAVEDARLDFTWLRPRISVKNLTIAVADEGHTLTLPEVQVTFSWKSLLMLKPVTSRVVLISPDLTIHRHTNNSIHVAGFEVSTVQNKKAADKPLDLTQPNESLNELVDFILSQRHIEINNGRIHYTDLVDDDAHSLALENVNFLLHRYPMAWTAGLQANLIGEHASPIDIRARLHKKFFESDNRLADLYGKIYADVALIDFATIAHRLNLDHFIHRGVGEACVWIRFADLRPTHITTDVALSDVSLSWQHGDAPFAFEALSGRMVQKLDHTDTLSLSVQDVQIKTSDEEPFRLGNATLETKIVNGRPADGFITVDSLDLKAFTDVGLALPLPDIVTLGLLRMNAQGVIHHFTSQWTGAPEDPTTIDVSTNFEAFSIDGIPNLTGPLAKAGFKGLSGAVRFDNKGGEVTLDAPHSSLHFPEIFVEEKLAFDTLKMKAHWYYGEKAAFKVDELIASNADASVNVHGGWVNTGDLGTLEVRGDLHYLNAAAAYRYIPLVAGGIGTNNWLRGALQGGIAKNGTVNVYGPLKQFPFKNQKNQGYIFRIDGQTENVKLDFLPSMKKNQVGDWLRGDWPVIDKINGQIVFEADSMTVSVDNAVAEGGGKIGATTATIPSYSQPGVPLLIRGQATGALADMAAYVNDSPISGILGHVFRESFVTGDADLKLNLLIPITDAMHTKVEGSVVLNDNQVHLKNIPPLDHATGFVRFSEKGVWAPNLKASVHGVPVTGSMSTEDDGAIIVFAQGTTGADLVAKIIDSPASTSLLDYLEGEAAASVWVKIQKGVHLTVTTDLVGTHIDAPAPFKKKPQEAWPLKFTMTPCGPKEACASQMALNVKGSLLTMAMQYSDTPRGLKVTRGYFAVQTPNAQLPTTDGLSLYVSGDKFATTEWMPVLDHVLASQDADPNADIKTMALNRLVANVKTLDAEGFIFKNVHANAQLLPGNRWTGTASSNLFDGGFAFTPAAGSTHAHIAADFKTLTIPNNAILEKTIEKAPQTTESLPSVTLKIDNFAYGTSQLGALALQATNRGAGANQAWELETFTLTNSDAKLSANGSWNSGQKNQSRTTVSVTLDVKDLGDLLARLALDNLINNGKGQLNAELSWTGAPNDFKPDTLSGEVTAQLLSGQITPIEPGAGRLASLMNVQQILRRLTLDFRDVIGKGFAFDAINAQASITNGLLNTNSIQVSAPQAAVQMTGWLDLMSLEQNFHVTVLPNVNLSSASVALGFLNPVVGVATFLGQWALQAPLSQLMSVEYDITGTIEKPVVTEVKKSSYEKASEAKED